MRNNLTYVAAVLSDILEHLKLQPPTGTADHRIYQDNPACKMQGCTMRTYSILIDPDNDPFPVCFGHFNEVMEEHLQEVNHQRAANSRNQ